MKCKLLYVGLITIFIVTLVMMAKYSLAININLRLPYPKSENWQITRDYNTATHRDYGYPFTDDRLALDFALNGCQSFDRPHLSVADGIIYLVKRSNVSYGNTVIVDHKNGLFSRYAHLNQILVNIGQDVKRGQILGTEGNTGNVEGNSCLEHPGTHLHFAMYQKQLDEQGEEKFVAYKPEPMSGYTNFLAGNWYVSDNQIYDPNRIYAGEENSQSQNLSLSWWRRVLAAV